MFLFVVRYLRGLARVPLLPQIFDGMLLSWACVMRPARLSAMEELEAVALRLPGVTARVHRFGGMEFFHKHYGELGHIHGHGLLDVRIGRAAANQILATGRVCRHHVLPEGGWVSFQLEGVADVPFALELLEKAQCRTQGDT